MMGSGTVKPNQSGGSGSGVMGKLLSGMQSAGVSFGGSAPSDEEKQRLRKMGINVYKKGGTVSASKRADGCAVKGKTRGRMV